VARFSRNLSQVEADLGKLVGVYLLVRKETLNATLAQEFLILRKSGVRKNIKTAAMISQRIIMRGTWTAMPTAVCVNMHGYRSGHVFDIMNIHLGRNTNDDQTLMGGIVSGVTSAGGAPVAMTVLCVKIGTAASHLMSLVEATDEEIINTIESLPLSITRDSIGHPLHHLFDDIFFTKFMLGQSDDNIARIRSDFGNDAMTYLSDELKDFLSQKYMHT
jgi:hypothetical protein